MQQKIGPDMVPVEKQDPRDLELMKEALAQAQKALDSDETPVGCIISTSDKQSIVARGHNMTNASRNGTAHAEFMSLNPILKERKYNPEFQGPYLGKGLIVYVTVEPCVMCASALRQIGIDKVYYGCSNDRFGGCGGVKRIHDDKKLVFSPTYEALGGYYRGDAVLLLRKFYITENTKAPKPKKKANRVLKTSDL